MPTSFAVCAGVFLSVNKGEKMSAPFLPQDGIIRPPLYTRREYMIQKELDTGRIGVSDAVERVNIVASGHPKVDMDGERKSWKQWEAIPNLYPPDPGVS